MTGQEFLCAAFGTRKISGTDEVTVNMQGFRVDEDCVISSYKVGKIELDPDKYNFKVATGLKAGEVHRVATGETITYIKLASGSITAILK